ncbi:MAG: hypothetical protein M1839_008907 [Geoglossum umbratile]|nr:MAG: hypothetical protein M1839_008907 [Geoglossum umbratile]
MGCGSRRKEEAEVKAEEKWDFINLDDFKTSSCVKPFSYGVLYILLIISISAYGIDLFTAVNLLFYRRWAGKVEPFIPIKYSRWIFSGCIILSWLILAFEWIRAVRVMKRGSVAESYLDPLAVRVQSIRMGKNGRGWRRFLVFTLLTKSKKGTEYVALFTYFSFKAWIRIILAEGPRQVINALTLYSVVKARLVPNGANAPSKGNTDVAQFFVNLRILAESSRIQAIVLGGMAWTLIVWVIRALNLLVAVILYLVFLWHHIPATDGGIKGYLTRKVDAKVRKIVAVKVQKALDKENAQRDAEEAKALKDGGKKIQPTVPTLDGFESTDELVKNSGPLGRYASESSLPSYSSRRSSQTTIDRQQPNPLGDSWGPFPVTRTNTQSSNSTNTTNTSYRSNAPLINNNNASGMPYGTNLYSPRSNTITSDRSLSPTYGGDEEAMYKPPRGAPRGLIAPMGRISPQEFSQATPAQMGYGPPIGRGAPRPGMDFDGRQSPAPIRNVGPPIDPYGYTNPSSPPSTASTDRGRGNGPTPLYNPRTRPSPAPGPTTTYAPYRTATANDPSSPPPRRNLTAPPPPQSSGMYFPPQPTIRSATAPPPPEARYEDLEMQAPARAGTAGGTRGDSGGLGRPGGQRPPFEGGF